MDCDEYGGLTVSSTVGGGSGGSLDMMTMKRESDSGTPGSSHHDDSMSGGGLHHHQLPVFDADSLVDMCSTGGLRPDGRRQSDEATNPISAGGGGGSSGSKARQCVGKCKVCGDEATGMYFGALVCVPCKVSRRNLVCRSFLRKYCHRDYGNFDMIVFKANTSKNTSYWLF